MNPNKSDLIKVTTNSIVGQTFHWHDDLELIIVTKGSIDLKLGYEWLHLKNGDMMFVNSGEVHNIKETDEKNKLLFIYLNCNQCYDYIPDFYETIAILPYGLAFEKINEHKSVIMNNISKLIRGMNNGIGEDIMEQHVKALLQTLIFCYKIDLSKEGDISVQANSERMEVIYHIINYLYSNSDHKVNLEDISQKEYLSLFYLSHSFKDATGYSFRDWLNFVRVEKAEKMLLNTSLPLTEISYQCGFSDIRYFNKHFFKWYKMNPGRYRDLFKESYEMLSKTEIVEDEASINAIMDEIGNTRPSMENIPEKEYNIYIDMNSDIPTQKLNSDWNKKLFCHASWLKDYRRLSCVKETAKDIGFSEIVIDNLFSTKANDEDGSMYEVLCLLLNIFHKIYIVIDESQREELYEIESFFRYFFKFNPLVRAKQIIILRKEDISSLDSKERRDEQFIEALEYMGIEYKNDDYRNLGQIIGKNSVIEDLTDYIAGATDGDIRIDWLYNMDCFKNATYYFYMFLSMVDGYLVECEGDYLLARRGKKISLLIYNEESRNHLNTHLVYTLQVKGVESEFKLVEYEWDGETDDVAAIVKNPQVMKHLENREYEHINILTAPTASFDYIDRSSIKDDSIEIITKLPSSKIHFIQLVPV